MTGSLVSSLLSRGGGSGGGGVPMSKVIVKSNTLPIAEIKYVGAMYIYAGETTAAYKHGYIYEGTSTPANTKTVSFSPNTISCTGENFWAFWKSEEGAPNNYTEIVKGEMVFVGGNTWNLIGRNTNNEIVKSYQQYDEDWEALGFSFTGTFSEGDSVEFNCAINETDDIVYWWQRIDVQPAGTSSSTGIAVDGQLSFDSQNPVQNKVITEALEETGYDTWKKPEDWVDIRSGALPNSIYFLVGHSLDYSAYNLFGFRARVSNSGTYDVYIDGVKKYTIASDSDTMINWQTLALETGYNTIYPMALKTHIVRVTPTVQTNNITMIQHRYVGTENSGTLWAHFSINNSIALGYFARAVFTSTGYNGNIPLLDAITANKDCIVTSDLGSLAQGCTSLKYLPYFEATNFSNAVPAQRFIKGCNNLRTVKLKNIILTQDQVFFDTPSLEKIQAQNAYVQDNGYVFSNVPKLKNLIPIDIKNTADTRSQYFLSNCRNIPDTFIDLSNSNKKRIFTIEASSSNRIDALKGLVLSPEAPFDNTTSPQIKVNYTGLDRAALVNLFKSMPYNVAYEKVGNPTIVDGVASGFSPNNYLKINNKFSSSSNFEIVVRGTAISEAAQRMCLAFNNGANGFLDIGSGTASVRLALYYNDSMTSFRIYPNLTEGQLYYIHVIKNNSTLTLGYSTDGTTILQSEDFSLESFNWAFSYILLGAAPWQSASGFGGSIDLNNTYIKVDGKPFFGPDVTKNLVPGGTVVGSPTITNGVASGFSSSKYITTTASTTYPQEWYVRFTTDSDISTEQDIIGTAGPIRVVIKNSKLNVKLTHSGTSTNHYMTSDLVASTTYLLKISMSATATNIVCKKASDADWETIYDDTVVTDLEARAINIGIYSVTYPHEFKGSIDLNNTYIKVDTSYAYRGMIPQEKICSVVGCTGTADLTADDKAIATSKGWYLTVQ